MAFSQPEFSCPQCGNNKDLKTERRPDGNTHCPKCNLTAKTTSFDNKLIHFYDFGEALRYAKKEGRKISRRGWNGNNIVVVYMKGYPNGIGANANTAEAYGVAEGTVLKFSPYLQSKNQHGDITMWTPSTTDVLAEDWFIVE